MFFGQSLDQFSRSSRVELQKRIRLQQEDQEERVPLMHRSRRSSRSPPSSHRDSKRQKPEETSGKPEDEVDDTSPLANPQPVKLSRLWALARPERYLLLLGTVALFLSSGANLAVPWLMGRIIDVVAKGQSAALLREIVLLSTVFFVVAAIFTFIRAAVFTVAGERIVARLRSDLYHSIILQEIGFFDRTKTGELVNRLSADTTMLQNALSVNISMVLRNIVSVLGSLTILFFFSWRLSLVMLSVVPIIAISTVLYGRYIRALAKKVQDALALAGEVATESIGSVRTVRAFSREQAEVNRYSSKVQDAYQLAKKVALAYGAFGGIVGFMGNGAMILVLWYGGTLVLRGEISTGQLASYIIYTVSVAFALGGLASLYTQFARALGASSRVFQLIDRVPEIGNSGGYIPERLDGHITLRNVTFSYPSRPKITVLDDVSLDLAPGRTLALVGPSGGGKSTIAALIERFYDIQQGEILIDGEEIRNISPGWLREQIAIVNQEPVLFATSIAENISYGRLTATREEIIEAATKANAHKFILEFPEGYDTKVGERGVRLSGGQKQRIAIARAILKSPKVLLLDEATSALDSESEHLVQEALERLMQGRTTLVIAHRLSTVRDADQLLVIDHGKVVERGTHDELIQKDGVYKQLVSRQMDWSG